MSDKGIPACNAYRVMKPCNTCPFINNKMYLEDGRVDDIKEMLSDGGHFVCHKTVYNLNNKLEESQHQERKMCAGAYEYLKKEGILTPIMRVAMATGIDQDLNNWINDYINEHGKLPEQKGEING